METEAIIEGVRRRERRALARAVTLIESSRDDHRAEAERIMAALTGNGHEALRIGLSGTPGVGKSTFIEAFGGFLTARGLTLAVLAVDPSSTRSGGSILGDKTRMERLARDPHAYVRPSPSRTALGGVTGRSRETVALMEAAGFDVVLIETVGVGQSETAVSEMSDVFTLLVAPGGGDELQGVKRGIMEAADIVLVNKADGDLAAEARRTASDYAAAFRLFRPRPGDPEGYPKVLTVSAAEEAGLSEAWEAIETLAERRRASGVWSARRAEQARSWFREELHRGMLERIERECGDEAGLEALESQVMTGRLTPMQAAQRAFGREGRDPGG